VTLPEAAALLGLTAATLRQQIANGRLAARKIGRDWSVSAREIERYRAVSLGRPGARARPARHPRPAGRT
jgi:excisionase family DNA binding protein